MMLDKMTFGSSPAAIFLADRLNELGDQKQTHRISSFINSYKKLMNEAVNLHNTHGMSTVLLYFIIDKISNDVNALVNKLLSEDSAIKYDQTVCNLMGNVLRGNVKSIKRRLKLATHSQKSRERIAKKMSREQESKCDTISWRATIDEFHDEITNEVLHARSDERIARRKLNKNNVK